jgi:hypothetical protein
MTELEKALAKRNQHGLRRLNRRERSLVKCFNMRSAKERRHKEAIAAGWTPEPKFLRAYRFEIGIRNKATGETCFVDLKSARQAKKIASLILKHL